MADDTGRLSIRRLGEGTIPSPMADAAFTGDDERVIASSDPVAIEAAVRKGEPLESFEIAGPRRRIFFDPARVGAGIVTCGGLCPGLNDVIRAIVMSLWHHYGVRRIKGFRYGYEGLSPRAGHEPLDLSPDVVKDIHQDGGSILASSRGPQDPGEMIETLERRDLGILFTIGGDGTLRGAHAMAEEAARRGKRLSIVGIPKTIDDDIPLIQHSFGFDTAVTESRAAIFAAHAEATGAKNGVGLVKLMGRHAGFIAAYAALAHNDVNFCLVPEVRFDLTVFLKALRERLARRGHAVVLVAEGAGQDILAATGTRDASGNVRLADVGTFLRDAIKKDFEAAKAEVNVKYIDPSYTIRSAPANARDSAYCLMLGHHAVHAAMSGRTAMFVGMWMNEFTHVPIAAAVARSRRIDPNGRLWASVVGATGQPRTLV
jgi:6-phosphofructokinase 1